MRFFTPTAPTVVETFNGQLRAWCRIAATSNLHRQIAQNGAYIRAAQFERDK
jgi:hypothetical protein